MARFERKEKSWVSKRKPEPYDLVTLRYKGGAEYSGWWSGMGWGGILLGKSLVNYSPLKEASFQFEQICSPFLF